MAAMAMAMANDPYFSLGTPKRQMSEGVKCALAHRLYHEDRSEREFIIHGEKIMAHDKKTAKKIYARRRPKKGK